MMVFDGDGLLQAVDRIYEAVERPELWPDAISVAGELIGGRRDFWAVDLDAEGPGINPVGNACHPTLFLARKDLEALDRYADQFGELIIRFLRIVFMSILWSPRDVGAREAIGLRLTQRYLPAFEAPAAGSMASPSRLALRNLIAALWEDGRVFSGDNLRCMRFLAPHLDRALRWQMRFSSAGLEPGMASGALDRLTLGVVFVDRAGRPLWLNRRAQEIIDGAAGLRLSGAGLAGQRASDTRLLRELVIGAVSADAHGFLAIGRDGNLRPLLLAAMPLRPIGSIPGSSEAACGVLFISDPDRLDDPNIDTLRQGFDLTYREAQMATAIARGHGLQAAADAMGVALTTARSQLQQVFAKTRTRHQAELAALLHRTLTHLRHD